MWPQLWHQGRLRGRPMAEAVVAAGAQLGRWRQPPNRQGEPPPLFFSLNKFLLFKLLLQTST